MSLIALVLIGVISRIIFDSASIAIVMFLIVSLAQITVFIRRMHDIGCRGWWILIPLVNIGLALIKGMDGENKFGADPLAPRPLAVPKAALSKTMSVSVGNLSAPTKSATVVQAKTVGEEQSRQAWSQLSTEMDEGFMDKGLWAQSFAENDGDQIKTKSRYMQARQLAISHELALQTAQAEAAQKAEEEAKRATEAATKEAAALAKFREAFEKPEKRLQLRDLILGEVSIGKVDDNLWGKSCEESLGDSQVAIDKYIYYRLQSLTSRDYINCLEQIAAKGRNNNIKAAFFVLVLIVFYMVVIYWIELKHVFNYY